MDSVNRCVCCGSPIPEGRQVCHNCEMNCGNCKWRARGLDPFCGNPKSPRHGETVTPERWCPAWDKDK